MNDVARVREVLGADGEHWIKGQLHNEDRTKFCLAGALQHTTRATTNLSIDEVLALMNRVNLATTIISRVIGEQYPERTRRTITTFNDHSDTTWADVAAVLDKAEQRLDERNSL